MSDSGRSSSYWDSVTRSLGRLLGFSSIAAPRSQGQEEQESVSAAPPSSSSSPTAAMHQRNDENRLRTRHRALDKVGHVVETRSRTRSSTSTTPRARRSNGVLTNGHFPDPSTSTPSTSNGVHHYPEETVRVGSKISPRKLKELQELNEMSKWRDPADGKQHRHTRRSMMTPLDSTKVVVSSPESTPPKSVLRSTRRQPLPEMELEPVRRAKRVSFHVEPPRKRQRVRLKDAPHNVAKTKTPAKTNYVLDFRHGISRRPRRRVLWHIRSYLKKRVQKQRPSNRAARLARKRPIKQPTSPLAIFARQVHESKNVGSGRARQWARSFVLRGLRRGRLRCRAFPRERVTIKRVLRLKRLDNARSLLPVARKRLRNGAPKKSAFKQATKRVSCVQLKTGVKWLALLTPCQRSCSCLGFKTRKVKWGLRAPHSKDVHGLLSEDLCSRCQHPLWQHRRKYETDDRRERYGVVRDIRILQQLMSKEKNKEKLRVYFVLLKDLISTIVENQQLPRHVLPSKRVAEHPFSIKRCVQQYMQTRDARRFGFINRHAQNLLRTIEEFHFPTPDKHELYSYSFLTSKYAKTAVERNFRRWYRFYYARWLVHCRLPQLLLSLPRYNACNIFGFHMVQLFDEYIALKLEQRFAETHDPEVKIVAVLFRKVRMYLRKVKRFHKRHMKKLPFEEEEGDNVLEKTFHSDDTASHAIGTRHSTTSNPILLEESGPFYFDHLPPVNKNQTLEVADALRFGFMFWKKRHRRHIRAFLPRRKGTKVKKVIKNITLSGSGKIMQKVSYIKTPIRRTRHSIAFRRDPQTLTNFCELSDDIAEFNRRAPFKTNCDKERAAGKIEMFVLHNLRSITTTKRNQFLLQFIGVIHRQLPKMPKHYILRLVMDPKHQSLILIKYNKRGSSPGWTVLGGICFRAFPEQSFSEVVFVAVHADHQVRGYGGYLMDELKRYHAEVLGYPNLLTFADKNAIGYFKKQGFSREIEVAKPCYHKYIKEYEGATLMYCHARICNTPDDIVYWARKLSRYFRYFHFKFLNEWYQKHPSLAPEFLHYDLLPMKLEDVKCMDNAGFALTPKDLKLPNMYWLHQYNDLALSGPSDEESVNTEDEELLGRKLKSGVRRKRKVSESKRPGRPPARWDSTKEDSHTKMHMLLEAVIRCPFSWPFHYPVDEYDAPSYHEVIHYPMTLETIEDRMDWGYYIHERAFFVDINRMLFNCYYFNTQVDGYYYHSCYRLHQYFNALAIQIFGERIRRLLLPIGKPSTIRKGVPKSKKLQVVWEPIHPYWYPRTHNFNPKDLKLAAAAAAANTTTSGTAQTPKESKGAKGKKAAAVATTPKTPKKPVPELLFEEEDEEESPQLTLTGRKARTRRDSSPHYSPSKGGGRRTRASLKADDPPERRATRASSLRSAHSTPTTSGTPRKRR